MPPRQLNACGRAHRGQCGGQLASFSGMLIHAAGVSWKCGAQDDTPGVWGREGVRTDLNSLPSPRLWVLGSMHPEQSALGPCGLRDKAPSWSRSRRHCPPSALLSCTGHPARPDLRCPHVLPAFVPISGHQDCPDNPQAGRGLSFRSSHWRSQSPSGRGSTRLGPCGLQDPVSQNVYHPHPWSQRILLPSGD